MSETTEHANGANGKSAAQVIDLDHAAMSDRQRILTFLAGHLAKKGHYQLAQVELRRIVGETGRPSRHGPEVRAWHRDESPELFELKTADALVAQIIAAAEENAYGFEANRFIVCAIDRRQSCATLVLRVDSDEQAYGGPDASPRGVLAQVMSQNERLHNKIDRIATVALEQMRQMLVQVADHNRQLVEREQRWQLEREKLISKQFERETSRMLVEASEARKGDATKKLLWMGEQAFAGFSQWLKNKGIEMPAVKKTAEEATQKQRDGKSVTITELVSMLWTSLSTEQVDKLLELLTAEQQAVFVPILERMAAKESQDDAIRTFIPMLTLAQMAALRDLFTDEQRTILGQIIGAAESRKATR